MMKDLTPLWQALARAQRALGGLSKDQRGPRGEYTSCEAAIHQARRVLLNEDLLLVVESARVEELTPEDIDEHGALQRSDVVVLNRQLRLVHTETGADIVLQQVWPIVPSRGRPLDHSAASADSFGLTYLLRGLLLFARGDAYEGEGEIVAEAVAAAPATVAAAPVNAPAPTPKPTPPAPPTAEALRSTTQALDASVTDEAADPSAEDLARYGWDCAAPSPADLEALPADEPVDVALARDLHLRAVERVGQTKALAAWRALGVALGKGKTPPTGGESRRFAATIALKTTTEETA